MSIGLLKVLLFAGAAGQLAAADLPGQVLVLWSQATPADLREIVFICESLSDAIVSKEYVPLSTAPSPDLSVTIVLDVLWNESFSRLYYSSRTSEVQIINGNDYYLKSVPSLDLDIDTELEQLARVSRWLGIQRLCVVLTPHSDLLPTVQSKFSAVQVEAIRVSEGAGMETLEVLVRKQIAPYGFTSFLILLLPQTTKLLLHAFQSNRLTANRLIVLLSVRSSMYRFRITDEELQGFTYLRPLYVTRRECSTVSMISEQLLCLIKEAISNPFFNEMSLKQIANRTSHVVAWVHKDRIDLSGYEEAEIQPNSSAAISTIQISINSGRANPSGLSPYDPVPWTSGAMLAQKDINAQVAILPFFKLEILNASLGVSEFNALWLKQQLATAHLGVALIHGIFSTMAIATYDVMSSLNYSIPQVGAAIVHSALSSVHKYPLFTRVAMSDIYIAIIYVKVMKLFGWSRVCFVYSSDVWDEGLTEFIFSNSKEMGIEICNRYSKIPSEAQSNSTELLTTLREVVESKVRILVLIAYGRALESVLVGLHSLGMRRGDLLLVAIDWLTPSLYDIADSERLEVVKELTQGAIMFTPASFVGVVGASVYSDFVKTYKETPSTETCFYYDAAMMIAHALNAMTAHGENWFEPEKLNKAIRNTKFIGCTGFVYIEDQTNNRALMRYTIVNAHLQDDGSVSIREIGTYDPASTVLFKFTEPIQWPGKASSVPTDMRENVPGCPFEQTHMLEYQPALALSAAIMSCVCLISIVYIVYIWRKYWYVQAVPLRKRVQASFEDYFEFGRIVIEALQYLTIGLKLSDCFSLLKWSGNLLAMRFDAFSSMGSAGYWTIFFISLGAVALWTIMLVLSKFGACRYCRWLCSQGDALAQTVCPILGELCFLPVLSTLLAIYQCPKIASKVIDSPSLLDAYLEWDCNQFCWEKSHMPFAVASFVCLLVYIPSAVFMRPAWQHIPLTLHIHTSPSFLMLKSIYQVAIAGVDRLLNTGNPSKAAVVFTILTLLFACGALKAKPYNYSRANLWHALSLVFVLLTSILHIASEQFPAVSSALWPVLLCLGLGVLAAGGLLYQAMKLPPLLVSRKGIQVGELFRFMFSREGRYLHIFTKTKVESTGEGNSTMRRVPKLQV